jgi:hypothetical protein
MDETDVIGSLGCNGFGHLEGIDSRLNPFVIEFTGL